MMSDTNSFEQARRGERERIVKKLEDYMARLKQANPDHPTNQVECCIMLARGFDTTFPGPKA